jgi:hypothetical protein
MLLVFVGRDARQYHTLLANRHGGLLRPHVFRERFWFCTRFPRRPSCRLQRLPKRNLSRPTQLGRALLSQPHLLEGTRSRWPFRGIRAASALHPRTAGLFSLHALTPHLGPAHVRFHPSGYESTFGSEHRRLSHSELDSLFGSRKHKAFDQRDCECAERSDCREDTRERILQRLMH